MAVGILSIGMMLIATMFPVGIYLTTVASERTMAAIVADEAFAKIQLYGLSSYPAVINDSNDYNDICNPIDSNEFSYPSTDPCSPVQYYWSALCRQTDPNDPNMLFQVTVFVARKTSPNHTYPYRPDISSPIVLIDRPRLIEIQITAINASDVLTVNTAGEAKYINPPTAVVDNATGKIYRVIDRKEVAGVPIVTLDGVWQDIPTATDSIWLIPPPVNGGKNAGVEVFQRIIRF